MRRMGRLLVVATPIGNLEDLSPRALEALSSAAVVYCEDTRRTGGLFARYGLTAPRVSCHGHNEHRRVDEALERLARGETLALVSDAGTPPAPLVSARRCFSSRPSASWNLSGRSRGRGETRPSSSGAS